MRQYASGGKHEISLKIIDKDYIAVQRICAAYNIRRIYLLGQIVQSFYDAAQASGSLPSPDSDTDIDIPPVEEWLDISLYIPHKAATLLRKLNTQYRLGMGWLLSMAIHWACSRIEARDFKFLPANRLTNDAVYATIDDVAAMTGKMALRSILSSMHDQKGGLEMQSGSAEKQKRVRVSAFMDADEYRVFLSHVVRSGKSVPDTLVEMIRAFIKEKDLEELERLTKGGQDE